MVNLGNNELQDPTAGMALELDQKKAEEKPINKKGTIVSSLLGLGGVIGGAIPSMIGTRQKGNLEKMQAGHGAGATAARQAGAAGARAAVGAAAAGHGRTRGLALREGLRSAENMVAQGTRTAASAGAQESQYATNALMQAEDTRRQTGLKLGSALGGGLGALGAVLTAADDQGTQPTDTAAAGPTAPVEAQQQAILDEGTAGLEQVQGAREAAGQPAPAAAPEDQGQEQVIQAGQAALDMLQAPPSPTEALAQAEEIAEPPATPADAFQQNEVKKTLAEAQAALARQEHAWATAQGDTTNNAPMGDATPEAQMLDRTWAWIQGEIFDGRMSYEDGMGLWSNAQQRAGVS